MIMSVFLEHGYISVFWGFHFRCKLFTTFMRKSANAKEDLRPGLDRET